MQQDRSWNWYWQQSPAFSSPTASSSPSPRPDGFLVSRQNPRFLKVAPVLNVPAIAQGDLSAAERVEDEEERERDDVEEEEEEKENEEQEEDEETVRVEQGNVVFLEYHIVYSPTYRVPVLYLRGEHADGRWLSTKEIRQVLECEEGNEHFVSQDEHPLLGTPYYFVHPCETATCLALLLDGMDKPSGLQVLQAWLSLVQSWTHIRLPLSQNDRNGY
ncbi:hypothetical protein THRCLA_03030 [Thraustotheca clavata]|uniref:Ubiquitin-like-conjugating enzyme ATG10 n=1 Tax=Thraustotheca clavata TaxID=74557 RepID=A0A1W0A394_9STRA|nr:hypothetical protein THRCLA_03030 [Thraustotheca clavata]